jgi:hypothetical protein
MLALNSSKSRLNPPVDVKWPLSGLVTNALVAADADEVEMTARKASLAKRSLTLARSRTVTTQLKSTRN